MYHTYNVKNMPKICNPKQTTNASKKRSVQKKHQCCEEKKTYVDKNEQTQGKRDVDNGEEKLEEKESQCKM
ncbi:hypothetical protein B0H19DRAFT_1203784 [Mycena capillaripes]|nr:hypothetical protein B0H19DRAFT_1203784 [Mycena capillaripes]